MNSSLRVIFRKYQKKLYREIFKISLFSILFVSQKTQTEAESIH